MLHKSSMAWGVGRPPDSLHGGLGSLRLCSMGRVLHRLINPFPTAPDAGDRQQCGGLFQKRFATGICDLGGGCRTRANKVPDQRKLFCILPILDFALYKK